jgi:quinol monooxygenase YgiN
VCSTTPEQFEKRRTLRSLRRATVPGIGALIKRPQRRDIMSANSDRSELIVTAFWEAKPGEEDAVAEILQKFLPQAQQEAWVKQFEIHRNNAKPGQFLFYEVFRSEAGFADHQQTEHFKTLIQGQALPKLAKREREQYRYL